MNTIKVYGTDQEIDKIAGRIKLMVKGGDKLSNGEARALAQISNVTGLNPFIGEIWYIPTKGPMIGIAGARRLFNEGNNGSDYAFVELIPCSAAEAGVPDDVKDVVACFRCEAHSSSATRQYQQMLLQTIEAMRAAGSQDPFGDAREVVGKKPIWQGWGYSRKSDQSTMNKVQLAKKRAEADALKKRIVVPFGLPEVEISVHENYVDAETSPVITHDDQGEDQAAPATDELIIESKAPTSSKAVVNNLITDFEWETFSKLVQSAQNAGIVVRTYNRKEMTPSLVNGASEYLKGAIAKAKA